MKAILSVGPGRIPPAEGGALPARLGLAVDEAVYVCGHGKPRGKDTLCMMRVLCIITCKSCKY